MHVLPSSKFQPCVDVALIFFWSTFVFWLISPFHCFCIIMGSRCLFDHIWFIRMCFLAPCSSLSIVSHYLLFADKEDCVGSDDDHNHNSEKKQTEKKGYSSSIRGRRPRTGFSDSFSSIGKKKKICFCFSCVFLQQFGLA